MPLLVATDYACKYVLIGWALCQQRFMYYS